MSEIDILAQLITLPEIDELEKEMVEFCGEKFMN